MTTETKDEKPGAGDDGMDFDAAFAEATKNLDGEGDDKPAAGDTPGDEPGNEPAPAPKDEPAPAPKDEPAPAPKDEPAPKPKPAPKDEPKDEPAPTEEPTLELPEFKYTDEEQKALEGFKKDFPEIASALELAQRRRDHEMKNAFTSALYQVVGHIYQDLTPALKGATESAQDRHFAAIERGAKDQHGLDFNEITKKDAAGETPLKSWIKTQPALLQGHLMSVYTEGSADEVVELVGLYKQAQAGGGPKPSTTATTEGKKPAAAPAPAAKPNAEAASSLEPVKSKRTAVETRGEDPNDFDGAFEKAAEAELGR